jgi:uncharacterized protein (TIGR02453 family)
MSIRPSFFAFLEELAEHNQREWFKAHEPIFRAEVEAPFLALVSALAPGLSRVAPHVRCDPARSGGSTLRIHRDIRFSRDKSPYKTHMSAMFLHRDAGRGPGMLGYFLRLGPEECLLGAGVHAPDGAALARIRAAIAGGGRRWARVSVGLQGEQRKRVPPGLPPDHPFVADLRRVEYFRTVPLSRREALSPDLPRTVIRAARALEPLLAFLAPPAGLPW